MSDLREILDRLGLSQYLGRLIEEGFERWDTILDIQESDLAYMGFKLGHRRVLQRAIARDRNIPENEPIPWLCQQPYSEDPDDADDKSSPRGFRPDFKGVVQTKRKYRRHPRPDENAPEKPPSAYVMFANHIREELKGQTLSFTEIARMVGEKWKSLEPDQKDIFEYQAATLKERYSQELATYKKTEDFKKYEEYLKDFKIKEAAKESGSGETASFTPSSEAPRKRPKLESIPSQGSTHSSLPGSSTTSVISIGGPAATASASSRSQQHAGESPSYQPANMAAGYARRESYTSPFPQPSTPASQLSPVAFAEPSGGSGQGIRQYQSGQSSTPFEAVTLSYRESPNRPTHHPYYDQGRTSGSFAEASDPGMMVHLPKISTQPPQHVTSYSRGPQPSPGDSPSQHTRRAGSISGTLYQQQQRPALHPSDTLLTQNSMSSSGSSSVPSLTPATQPEGDGRQVHGHVHRSLPPLRNPSPSHGQRGSSGYFSQRTRDITGGNGGGNGGGNSGYPGQGHGSTSSSPRSQLPSLAEQTMQDQPSRRGGDGADQT
ncbi:hypothetical protein DRE_06603 [Drechslerella stenobrocha 248]|uniref:HMG box domain-containing protein n=1 Tax=Drechslerella stenobrocha 248 TaxID=1043628 RepID=W7HNA7_9PEZI|nr:hypothetical protein DRE_06603 [Drechslerella stenobrocha 248]